MYEPPFLVVRLANFLKLEAYNKYFWQYVGKGRGNLVENWSINISCVIPIHCRCDLLYKKVLLKMSCEISA